MATKTVSNKELNEKVDKLTEMFTAFVSKQMVQNADSVEEESSPKKRGRPKQSESQQEQPVARKRKLVWENTFVDNRKEHLDDSAIDKKLAVVLPVDKGVRKSGTVKSLCSTCDKQENVPKQFVFEGHHTCQKCLKSKIGK